MLKTDGNPDGVAQSVFDEMTRGMKEDRAHFFAGFFKDFYGVAMLSNPLGDALLERTRSVAMQANLKAALALGARRPGQLRRDARPGLARPRRIGGQHPYRHVTPLDQPLPDRRRRSSWNRS